MIALALLVLAAGRMTLAGFVESHEAESVVVDGSLAAPVSDAGASGGEALRFTGDTVAEMRITTARDVAYVAVKARGPRHGGIRAELGIELDGETHLQKRLTSDIYEEYAVAVPVRAGTHTIGVRARDATRDRPLFADVVLLRGRAQSPADTSPPEIVATSPAGGASNVGLGERVSVTFSEDVMVSTLTEDSFYLEEDPYGRFARRSGVVSYDSATRTAVLEPDGGLSPDSDLRATLTTEVRDLAGNPLSREEIISFDTHGSAPPPAQGRVYPQGFTPPSGATIVNPEITCDTDPESEDAAEPVGMWLINSGITVINPEIDECQTGVWVKANDGVVPRNVRIIADRNYPGYHESRFHHNRTPIRVDNLDGGEIGDVTPPSSDQRGSKGFEMDQGYRGIYVLNARNLEIHHTTTIGKDPEDGAFGSGTGDYGAYTGIILHGNFKEGPPYVLSGNRIHHNYLENISEEAISLDARNRGSDSMTREQDTVSAVDAESGWIELSSPNWAGVGTDYAGYRAVFSDGAARGEVLEITAHGGGERFFLNDPDKILRRVASGDSVGISMVFEDNRIYENHIDAAGARVGIALHGNAFGTLVSGNLVTGRPDHSYPHSYNLRLNAAGTGSVPQCILASSQSGVSDEGSLTGNHRRSPVMNSAITGNRCEGAGDVSLHQITWGGRDLYESPNYWSGNTFSSSSDRLWAHQQRRLSAPPRW